MDVVGGFAGGTNKEPPLLLQDGGSFCSAAARNTFRPVVQILPQTAADAHVSVLEMFCTTDISLATATESGPYGASTVRPE